MRQNRRVVVRRIRHPKVSRGDGVPLGDVFTFVSGDPFKFVTGEEFELKIKS
jgi:hypothetical protein